MGDYFECELRTKNDTEETFVAKVWLRLIPRIGEDIQTVLPHDNLPHDFTVKRVLHLAGDKFVGHRVILYVSHL